MSPSAALEGVRVVDATCGRGERAGRVLADLGAEVIQIEPPGGVPTRRLPPFETAEGGEPGTSLCWAAAGLGKRSVVLDVFDTSEQGGAERLRDLLRGADVFIESFDPGALAAVGLDPATVCEENPSLIYASLTPFGQDGPLARAPATDLSLEAAGGLLGLQGDPDRPPVPIGFPQAFLHAGVQAAADIVGAEECLKRAFFTDVTEVLKDVRAKMGAAADPLTALRESDEIVRRAKERKADQDAGSSYA